MKLHLKLTSAMLSALMCASMVMAPVSVIADDSAAPSETQTAETTEKEEPKETKAASKETEKPAPKETEKQETEATEKTEPAETEKQEPEVTEKDPETTEKQEAEATEEQKPSETEKQEPAETEKTEPETTETQEPTQTEETAPEETVPEVKPEKGPVTTARRKAKKEVSITKTKDNTCLGTSKIAKPAVPSGKDSLWSGSYVYFGNFDGTPTKYRVLSPNTSAYGESSLFLDSDNAIFMKRFDGNSSTWSGSDIQQYLNSTYLNNMFTSNERNAIAKSYGDGGLSYAEKSYEKETFGKPVAVNDYIFLLDASEVLNKAYGYSADSGMTTQDSGSSWDSYKVENRNKNNHAWYLRSCDPVGNNIVGIVDGSGYIFASLCTYNNVYISPALNVKNSSILFSTAVSGELGKAGTEYKLTLNDPNLRIEIPSVKKTSITGNTVTVHYRLNGTNNENVNRVSVLIRRRTNWNILLYEALTVSSISSGKGTFTLPSSLSLEDWGAATDVGYDVFILAEQTFGSQTTDYASELVSVDKPVERNLTVNPYIAYYKQDGTGPILDQEGESGTVSTNMTKVGTGDVVTVGATPKSGYSLKKIEWRNGVAGSATDITTKASFTVGDKDPYVYVYFQKLNPDEPVKYQVHYSILNENGSVDDSGKCGTVVLNKTEAESGEKITVTVTPNSGYELYQIAVCDANLNDSVNITATKSFTVKNYDPYVYVMFIRERQSNPLTASGRTAKVKYKKLRKKKQTVARAKVMNVSKAQGNVTYKLTGVKRGKSKKYKKYFTINAKTGNVTIKKKLKKGTYKVTCTVSAAGNGSYKAGTKSVTFKIKVK